MKRKLLRSVLLLVTVIATGLAGNVRPMETGGSASLPGDMLAGAGNHLAANIQSLAALPEPSSIIILGTALFLISRFGNRRLLRTGRRR